MAGNGIQGADARLSAWAERTLRIAACALLLVAMPCLAQTASVTGVGSQFEMVFWQSVDSGNDPALYEAYLAKYPEGTFAGVARAKLARLRPATPAGSAHAPTPSPMVSAGPALAAPPAAPVPLVPVPFAPAQPAARAVQSLTAPSTTTALLAPPPPERVLRPAPAVPLPAPMERAPAGNALASAAPSPDAAVTAAPAPSAQVATISAPSVTAAPLAQSASDSDNGAALRRLLGALGDSQRISQSATLRPAATAVALPPAELVPIAEVSFAPGAAPMSGPVSGPVSGPASEPLREIAVGPLPSDFALPPRPAMAKVPGVALPPTFCSAEARNQFHNGTYIPAVEAAKRNNDSTNAHMRLLQDLYDRNQLSGDINPMNALAAEARAYGPAASAAFEAQSALVRGFNALMAVPIIACEVPK